MECLRGRGLVARQARMEIQVSSDLEESRKVNEETVVASRGLNGTYVKETTQKTETDRKRSHVRALGEKRHGRTVGKDKKSLR